MAERREDGFWLHLDGVSKRRTKDLELLVGEYLPSGRIIEVEAFHKGGSTSYILNFVDDKFRDSFLDDNRAQNTCTPFTRFSSSVTYDFISSKYALGYKPGFKYPMIT